MNIKLEPWEYMPERAYSTDAGADLRTPYNETIEPREATVDLAVRENEKPLNTF